MRPCVGCGTELKTSNPRALYCGVNCRAKASKARSAGVPEPAARPLAVVSNLDPASPVAAATKAELDQADRLNTALGQAALALAVRIDSGMDTGSALAAAVKQLQVTLSAATAGAEVAVSRLDQMRARRDQKRA